MSYVNKKTRAFRKRSSDEEIIHVRSEARMKEYPSATDSRAWSDIVEERRQHILEYQAKNKGGFCLEKIIPLEVLIDAIMANKNMQIRRLEKRITYLEKLLEIYSQLDLSEEQKQKLDELRNELEKVQAELGSLKSEQEELKTIYDSRKRKGEEYPGGKPKKRDKKALKRRDSDRRRPVKRKDDEEKYVEDKNEQRKKKVRTPAREILTTSGEEETPAPKRFRSKRPSAEKRKLSGKSVENIEGDDKKRPLSRVGVQSSEMETRTHKKKPTSKTDQDTGNARPASDAFAESSTAGVKSTNSGELGTKMPKKKPTNRTDQDTGKVQLHSGKSRPASDTFAESSRAGVKSTDSGELGTKTPKKKLTSRTDQDNGNNKLVPEKARAASDELAESSRSGVKTFDSDELRTKTLKKKPTDRSSEKEKVASEMIRPAHDALGESFRAGVKSTDSGDLGTKTHKKEPTSRTDQDTGKNKLVSKKSRPASDALAESSRSGVKTSDSDELRTKTLKKKPTDRSTGKEKIASEMTRPAHDALGESFRAGVKSTDSGDLGTKTYKEEPTSRTDQDTGKNKLVSKKARPASDALAETSRALVKSTDSGDLRTKTPSKKTTNETVQGTGKETTASRKARPASDALAESPRAGVESTQPTSRTDQGSEKDKPAIRLARSASDTLPQSRSRVKSTDADELEKKTSKKPLARGIDQGPGKEKLSQKVEKRVFPKTSSKSAMSEEAQVDQPAKSDTQKKPEEEQIAKKLTPSFKTPGHIKADTSRRNSIGEEPTNTRIGGKLKKSDISTRKDALGEKSENDFLIKKEMPKKGESVLEKKLVEPSTETDMDPGIEPEKKKAVKPIDAKKTIEGKSKDGPFKERSEGIKVSDEKPIDDKIPGKTRTKEKIPEKGVEIDEKPGALVSEGEEEEEEDSEALKIIMEHGTGKPIVKKKKLMEKLSDKMKNATSGKKIEQKPVEEEIKVVHTNTLTQEMKKILKPKPEDSGELSQSEAEDKSTGKGLIPEKLEEKQTKVVPGESEMSGQELDEKSPIKQKQTLGQSKSSDDEDSGNKYPKKVGIGQNIEKPTPEESGESSKFKPGDESTSAREPDKGLIPEKLKEKPTKVIPGKTLGQALMSKGRGLGERSPIEQIQTPGRIQSSEDEDLEKYPKEKGIVKPPDEKPPKTEDHEKIPAQLFDERKKTGEKPTEVISKKIPSVEESAVEEKMEDVEKELTGATAPGEKIKQGLIADMPAEETFVRLEETGPPKLSEDVSGRKEVPDILEPLGEEREAASKPEEIQLEKEPEEILVVGELREIIEVKSKSQEIPTLVPYDIETDETEYEEHDIVGELEGEFEKPKDKVKWDGTKTGGLEGPEEHEEPAVPLREVEVNELYEEMRVPIIPEDIEPKPLPEPEVSKVLDKRKEEQQISPVVLKEAGAVSGQPQRLEKRPGKPAELAIDTGIASEQMKKESQVEEKELDKEAEREMELDAQKLEHRCAAMIRQARERCAAHAAHSGGIVILPDSRLRLEEMIPSGFLPGEVLPKVVTPRPVVKPGWAKPSEDLVRCKAVCSKKRPDERALGRREVEKADSDIKELHNKLEDKTSTEKSEERKLEDTEALETMVTPKVEIFDKTGGKSDEKVMPAKEGTGEIQPDETKREEKLPEALALHRLSTPELKTEILSSKDDEKKIFERGGGIEKSEDEISVEKKTMEDLALERLLTPKLKIEKPSSKEHEKKMSIKEDRIERNIDKSQLDDVKCMAACSRRLKDDENSKAKMSPEMVGGDKTALEIAKGKDENESENAKVSDQMLISKEIEKSHSQVLEESGFLKTGDDDIDLELVPDAIGEILEPVLTVDGIFTAAKKEKRDDEPGGTEMRLDEPKDGSDELFASASDIHEALSVDEVVNLPLSSESPKPTSADKKVVPKLILAWEETDSNELTDDADFPSNRITHRVSSDAHIGGRLSRVLSGDATGLGNTSIPPLVVVSMGTPRTLSGEILQRRISERVLDKKSSDLKKSKRMYASDSEKVVINTILEDEVETHKGTVTTCKAPCSRFPRGTKPPTETPRDSKPLNDEKYENIYTELEMEEDGITLPAAGKKEEGQRKSDVSAEPDELHIIIVDTLDDILNNVSLESEATEKKSLELKEKFKSGSDIWVTAIECKEIPKAEDEDMTSGSLTAEPVEFTAKKVDSNVLEDSVPNENVVNDVEVLAGTKQEKRITKESMEEVLPTRLYESEVFEDTLLPKLNDVPIDFEDIPVRDTTLLVNLSEEMLTPTLRSLPIVPMLTERIEMAQDYIPRAAHLEAGSIMEEIIDRSMESSELVTPSYKSNNKITGPGSFSLPMAESKPVQKGIQAIVSQQSAITAPVQIPLVSASSQSTPEALDTVKRKDLPVSAAVVPVAATAIPVAAVATAAVSAPVAIPVMSAIPAVAAAGILPSFFGKKICKASCAPMQQDNEVQTQEHSRQDKDTETDNKDERESSEAILQHDDDTDPDVTSVCPQTGLVCQCNNYRSKGSPSKSGDSEERPEESQISERQILCRGPCARNLCDSRFARTVYSNNIAERSERNREILEKRIISLTPKDSKEDLPTLLIHKDAEIIALRNALAAKESFCAEQRKIATAALEQLENIKNIAEERDDLRKKLENSQNELEQLKKNIAMGKPFGIEEDQPMHVPFGEMSPDRCEEEITILEKEIDDMRSGKLTADLEAKVIRKEVEVLKKYCSKLSVIQMENHHLKNQIARYEDKLNRLGFANKNETEIEDLKKKLDTLGETMKERDDLKVKCAHLEKQLYSYNDLPEEVEVFKQRSMLLDEVLQDRDRLSKRVEQLRGIDEEVYNLRKKAARVDELQETLMYLKKDKVSADEELDHMRCRCSMAEIEAFNQKAEGDTLRSRIVCLEHEVESLKCMCTDKDRLRQERDHLKRSLDELVRMENDFDHMKTQLKCLEVLKAERDMFKAKYENMVGLECECDILRVQVDKAKQIERERDALENQVEDLEICIADQENEIRRLVCHIDVLAKGRDEQQEKLKDVLGSMRAELEQKDSLIQSSEEKLASLQNDLRNSIQGLSSETTQLRNKNEHLEKCCHALQIDYNSVQGDYKCLQDDYECLQQIKTNMEVAFSDLKQENKNLDKRISDLTADNEYLMKMLQEKENSIKTLQEVLKDHEPILSDFDKAQRTLKQAPQEKVVMRNELEAAQEENRKLQETLMHLGCSKGDEHLQELLKQSKFAVQRIALELSKQYEEWDCIKNKLNEINKEDGKAEAKDGRKRTNTKEARDRGQEPCKACLCANVGIGTEDSRKWDCRRKKGDIQDLSRTGTYDSKLWDCNKKKSVPVQIGTVQGKSSCDCISRGVGTEERQTEKRDKGVEKKPYEDVSQEVVEKVLSLPGIRPCTCTLSVDGTQKKSDDDNEDKEEGNSKTTDKGIAGLESFEFDVSKWSCKQQNDGQYENIVKTAEDKKSEIRYEPDVSKWSCQPPVVEDVGAEKSFVKPEDEIEEEMHTARSTESKCKYLEEKIELLEKELAQANETILKLQEGQAGSERLVVENDALRRHSSEVQEVAKDQIEDLVEHLKNARERLTTLEDENVKLNTQVADMQLEKDHLLNLIKELQDGRGDEALDNLKRDLECCVADKAALLQQLELLENQLSQDIPEDDKLRSLLAANKDLQERLREEANLRQNLEANCEDLQSQIFVLEKKPAVAGGDGTELDELKKKIQQELNLRQNAEDKILGLQNRNFSLEEQITELQNRIIDLEKRLSEGVGNDKLKKDLEEEKSLRQNTEITNQQLQNHVAMLEDQLSKLLSEDQLNLKNLYEAKLKKLEEENSALRKKVLEDEEQRQKVEAKMRDLEKKLKMAQEMLGSPAEVDKIKNDLETSRINSNNLLSEIENLKKQLHDQDELRAQVDKLKEDKEKTEKMLTSNVVTTTRRSSKLEDDMNSLAKKNRQLQDQIDRFKQMGGDDFLAKSSAYKNESDQLRKNLEDVKEELERLRKTQPSTDTMDALMNENKNLKMKIDALTKEISELKELRKPVPGVEITKSQLERDSKEKEDLQATIDQLENHLKNMKKGEKKVISMAPSDELQNLIKDLTKRLENAETRAESAETSLKNMKASDPTAMLNAEINKLKQTIAEFENESVKLNQSVAQGNNETSKLKMELDGISNKAKKLTDENDKLKQKVSGLQKENDDLKLALDKLRDGQSGDESLKEEIKKLKAQVVQMENEIANLKADLNQKDSEIKNAYEKVSKLQDENGDLKQNLTKLKNENDKLKKDLDNSSSNDKKNLDRIEQLEKDNAKYQKDIQNLESDLSKVKKELDHVLNSAKITSSSVGDLQGELAKLKQQLAKLTEEKTNLKTKLDAAENGNRSSSEKSRQLEVDIEKAKRAQENAESQLSKLQKDLDSANAEAKKTAAELSRQQNENANLKDKLAKLDAENAKLKKDLAAASEEAKKFPDLQNEDSKLKQKLAFLENENTKLKNDLVKAFEEAKKAADKPKQDDDKFVKRIAKLEEDNTRLNKELNTALSELSKANATISQMQDEQNKFKQKFGQSESENDKLKKDLNKALDVTRKGASEESKLRDNESALKQRLAHLESENAKLKMDLDAALASGKANSSNAQTLKDENNKLQQRVAQVEEENAKLKKELDTVLKEQKLAPPSEEVDKLKQKYTQLENANSKLKKDLDSTVDEHKKCPKTISQLQNEIENLKKKIAGLEKDVFNWKNQYEGAMGDMKANNAELAQLKDHEANLKQLVTQVQNDNNKLNKDLTSLNAELKSNAGNLAQSKDELNKLKQKFAQIENENSKLKKDLDATLDDMKKAQKSTSQLKDDEVKLKQRIATLESENAKLKKDLDSITAEAKKGLTGADQMKSDEGKLRDRLAQLENENKKLKSDLNNALDETKKSGADLTKIRDDDLKLKQQIAKLEMDNIKLKKDLEKTLKNAQSESGAMTQLKEENNKLKQRIRQLEGEIGNLKSDLNNALENAKTGASGLTRMQADDAKSKQRISQLEKDNAKLKNDLETAMKEAKGGSDTLNQLRGENSKQKQMISQLENEITKMRQDLESAMSESKKGASGLSNLQEENTKLKQKIIQLEKDNTSLKKNLDSAQADTKAASTNGLQLSDGNVKLNQKVKQLEIELAKLKKDLSLATEEQKKAAANLSKIKDDEVKLKQRLADLESTNSQLKQDLDSESEDARNSKSETGKLRDENTVLKRKLAQVENDNTKLKKDLDAALNDTKNKLSEVGRLKDDNMKLRQKISDLENNNAKMKKDIDLAFDDSKIKAVEIQRLQDENAKLKQRIAELESNNAKTKKNLDSALADSRNVAGDVTSMNEVIAKLKQTVSQRDNQINDLKKDLDKSLSESKDKNSKIAELTDDITKLKMKIKELENQATKLGDQLVRMKQDTAQKDSQTSDLKNNFDQALLENKKKEATIDRLQKENARLQARLKEQEKQEDLIDDLSKLRLELVQKENQIKDLKKKLDKVKDKDQRIANLAEENAKLKAKEDELQGQITELIKMKGEVNKLGDKNINEKRIEQLQEELAKQKKECNDSIASLKQQYDREIKNLLKKNEDSIAKLQKTHEDFVKDLNERHDNDIKSLQDALRQAKIDLDEITKDRDKLKKLLEDQRRKSLDIKDKVEQVESIIMKERQKNKDERRKSVTLEEKSEEDKRSIIELELKVKELQDEIMALEKALADEKKKNAELVKGERDSVKKLDEEKVYPKMSELLAMGNEQLKSHIEGPIEGKDKGDSVGPKSMSADQLKMETFKTVSLPDVIAITTPLSDKELKFFGKKPCSCIPNMNVVVDKLARNGLETLTIEELQLLHSKIIDVLTKIGQSSGVLRLGESDRLGLMRRIASLEGDLMKKQKYAQQKVIAMQVAVKLEKERLSELRKNLEEEKQKNSDLLSQIGSQSKVVSNIEEERDLIQRQKSYHEQRLEQYIVAIEEERAKSRNLEDELEKEKSNIRHLKSLLEAERDRSRQNKRKDTESLEAMRIKLEKTVNSEMMLRMKLQEKTVRRSPSPGLTPVKDTSRPYASGSRTRAFYTDLSLDGSRTRMNTRRTNSGHSGTQTGSSNGLDMEDK